MFSKLADEEVGVVMERFAAELGRKLKVKDMDDAQYNIGATSQGTAKRAN